MLSGGIVPARGVVMMTTMCIPLSAVLMAEAILLFLVGHAVVVMPHEGFG